MVRLAVFAGGRLSRQVRENGENGGRWKIYPKKLNPQWRESRACVRFNMELPPLDPSPDPSSLDPFSGYLEVGSVIDVLKRKRDRILQEGEQQVIPEAEGKAMVGRVEAGILEAQALKDVYEQRLEDVLHAAANRADAVRALFDTVTRRMEEMREWMAGAVEGLPSEDREEWDLLVADYERIREELGGEPPPRPF